MKRRKFIQTSSIMTLPVLLSGMEVTAISKSKLADLIGGEEDRVLVLVQLNGGNDGLNTLIPLDQYDGLMKVRSNLMIPTSNVLKLKDNVGVHPALTGFRYLYNEGSMSIVQGVAYPNQNRSHFRSTDIWTTASDSEQYISTGWLGRYFDLNHSSYPDGYPNSDHTDPFAITLGVIVSETCQGKTSNFSFTVNSEEDVKELSDTVGGTTDGSCHSNELSFLKDIIRQTNAYSLRVKEAFDKGNNLVQYEDNSLARQLKIVANLISGGLKTKIYVVSQGGYDTHANQVVDGEPLTGSHTQLLSVLGNAIESFQKDLKALGVDKKVLGMTFSEFGRRIKSNDSFGTDHGTAAPVFAFGSCINPGIIGSNPQIGNNVDDEEGVAMQYDFRSLYASILQDWFKVSKEDIKKVLFKEFQHIPFIVDCNQSTSNEEISDLPVSLYPNPVVDYITIEADNIIGNFKLEVFNASGFVVYQFDGHTNNKIEHSINFGQFISGTYFVRILNKNKASVNKIVKI